MKQISGEMSVVQPYVDNVRSIWAVPADMETSLNLLMDQIALVDGTLVPLHVCKVGSVAISR